MHQKSTDDVVNQKHHFIFLSRDITIHQVST